MILMNYYQVITLSFHFNEIFYLLNIKNFWEYSSKYCIIIYSKNIIIILFFMKWVKLRKYKSLWNIFI